MVKMVKATGEVIQVPTESPTVFVMVRVTRDAAKLLKPGDKIEFEVVL